MSFEKYHREKTPLETAVMARNLDSFDEQWMSPEMLTITDEQFALYDVRPSEAKSEYPVTVIPGWNATPETWKNNIREIVAAGRRAVSIDAAHGSEITINADTSEAELRRMSAVVSALDHLRIQKSDLVGHSNGGLDALLLAHSFPERFRNIVLINPAGLIGSDSFIKLVGRFAKEKASTTFQAIKEGTNEENIRINKIGSRSMLNSPRWSFKEVQSLANADVVELLREVKQKGVKIVIIHGPDDPVFPFERMSSQLSEQKTIKDRLGENRPGEGGAILELVDGVYSVRGGHQTFVAKASEYTRIIDMALTALESEKKYG